MRRVELEQDGDPIEVVIVSERGPVARHVLHAVGGSLAYFKGGPGAGAAEPKSQDPPKPGPECDPEVIRSPAEFVERAQEPRVDTPADPA